jgi:hypothetical protein
LITVPLVKPKFVATVYCVYCIATAIFVPEGGVYVNLIGSVGVPDPEIAKTGVEELSVSKKLPLESAVI